MDSGASLGCHGKAVSCYKFFVRISATEKMSDCGIGKSFGLAVSQSYTTSYDRNDAGNLIGVAYPSGRIVGFDRGARGEIEQARTAPQSSYETGKPDGRYFTRVSDLTSEQIDAKLEREKRFDTDIWIIEVEAAGEIGDLIEIRAD